MFQNSTLARTVDLSAALPRGGVAPSLQRAARLAPLPRSLQEYLLWTFIMTCLAGLVSVQIWLSLQIARAEEQLAVLEQQVTDVEQENAQLLWQISGYTNLSRIKTEAVRMGYVPALTREYRPARGQAVAALLRAPQSQPSASAPVILNTQPLSAPAAATPGAGWEMPTFAQLRQGFSTLWHTLPGPNEDTWQGLRLGGYAPGGSLEASTHLLVGR